MYYEAKVLFVLSLWHPATQGSEYLYHTLIEPLLSAQEPHIDAALAESQAWIKTHVTNNLDGYGVGIQYNRLLPAAGNKHGQYNRLRKFVQERAMMLIEAAQGQQQVW